jgi:hypothetical protein
MKPLLAFAFLSAAACAGDSALGQVGVAAECSPTDFACVTAGLDGPIAVGGVVPLALDADLMGASTPAIDLLAADPAVLKVSGTEVRGEGEGVSALLLLAEGRVVDFTHVFVSAPDRLGLHRRDGGLEEAELVDEVELLVGDEIVLDVVAYRGSQRLLGAADSQWSAAGEVVTILRDGAPRRRRLVARSPGETELRVAALSLDAALTVRVLP